MSTTMTSEEKRKGIEYESFCLLDLKLNRDTTVLKVVQYLLQWSSGKHRKWKLALHPLVALNPNSIA